jgi:hypothetical protein
VEGIFGDVPQFILVIEENCAHVCVLTLKQKKKFCRVGTVNKKKTIKKWERLVNLVPFQSLFNTFLKKGPLTSPLASPSSVTERQ